LLLDLLDVRLGRGLSPRRATSFIAKHLAIEPADAESTYTLDGDLYTSSGPVTVQVGPALQIVKPQGWRERRKPTVNP
jgi:hypothetical protein